MAEPKIVSGDEHPSGLRDAIAAGENDFLDDCRGGTNDAQHPLDDESLAAFVEKRVRAWLSVVSEEEIAAREALADLMSFIDRVPGMPWQNIERGTDNPAFVRARIVLARTSGLPKETQ